MDERASARFVAGSHRQLLAERRNLGN